MAVVTGAAAGVSPVGPPAKPPLSPRGNPVCVILCAGGLPTSATSTTQWRKLLRLRLPAEAHLFVGAPIGPSSCPGGGPTPYLCNRTVVVDHRGKADPAGAPRASIGVPSARCYGMAPATSSLFFGASEPLQFHPSLWGRHIPDSWEISTV